MKELSASGLADLAGVAEAEVARLVELGVLVPRDGAGPFRETDVQKVRLAVACEQAGLPMAGDRRGDPGGAAVVCVPGGRAVPALGGALDADLPPGEPGDRGAARHARRGAGVDGVRPGRPRRADAGGRAGGGAAAAAGPVQRDLRPGLADPARPGPRRRPAAARTSWTEAYQARFEGLALESGADQRTAMELAAQLGGDFLPLVDPALLGIYRRQQQLSWTEHLVERIENELEAAGVLGRPERAPAMAFLDLNGYTHLTEQQGDATAAALAETLAVLVTRSSREHGGVPRPMSGWPPARWPPRVATTSAAPSTWPPGSPPTPAPARCWSASASPSRPRPPAWSSARPARSSSRGSPIRCGCWRPAGRERLTPRPWPPAWPCLSGTVLSRPEGREASMPTATRIRDHCLARHGRWTPRRPGAATVRLCRPPAGSILFTTAASEACGRSHVGRAPGGSTAASAALVHPSLLVGAPGRVPGHGRPGRTVATTRQRLGHDAADHHRAPHRPAAQRHHRVLRGRSEPGLAGHERVG